MIAMRSDMQKEDTMNGLMTQMMRLPAAGSSPSYSPLGMTQYQNYKNGNKQVTCSRSRLLWCIGLIAIIMTISWIQITDLHTLLVTNICGNRTLLMSNLVVDDDGTVHPVGTEQHIPQCIVIGVRKCGTRALLDFLNIHPRIVAASHEVHFFDNDTLYKQGLEVYRKRMPYSYQDQITVEKSPAYFITPQVPQRIHAMNASIKILLIVRNPVVRTLSDFTQIYEKRLLKNQSNEQFEKLVVDKQTGRINTKYRAVQISVYQQYLKEWLQIFPRDQILVVNGDRLIKDPASEMRKVEMFLGLEHIITEDKFYMNHTRGFHCIKNGTSERCLTEGKGRKHPAVDPKVIKKLTNFFRPHNDKLFQLVGQTFDWH